MPLITEKEKQRRLRTLLNQINRENQAKHDPRMRGTIAVADKAAIGNYEAVKLFGLKGGMTHVRKEHTTKRYKRYGIL